VNQDELGLDKLLIRGFGVRVPGGAPAKTCPNGILPWNQSWNHRALLRYGGRLEPAGTGHIERLPSGSYRVHVYAGTDPLTGRRLRYRQTVRTKRQAQVVLGRLLEQAAEGRRPDTDVTVADVLTRYMAVAELDPSTRNTYAGYIRRTILPALGSTELAKSVGRCWTPSMRGCADAATWHAPASRSASTGASRA
jgi:hypothetical protein